MASQHCKGIACFHPDRIPESVIVRLVSIIEEGDIVDDLSDAKFGFEQLVLGEMVSRFSLLTMAAETSDDRCYTIHRLMRLVVHARDGGKHRSEALTRALAAIYAECRHWSYQTVVDAKKEERDRMFTLLPHVKAISDQLSEPSNTGLGGKSVGGKTKRGKKQRSSKGLLDLLHDLPDGEEDASSEDQLSRSFGAFNSSRSPGELLREHATILRAVGYIEQFTANYTGAIDAYEQALGLLQEATQHDDDEELAATLQQLGHVLTSKGDNSEAIIYYTDAFEMLKRLHGKDDHPSVGAMLHRLATLLDQTNDFEGAIKMYTESLEMKRRIAGPGNDDSGIASTLHRMGTLRVF
jgi:tetratricopeptide (TPR) repeat protein